MLPLMNFCIKIFAQIDTFNYVFFLFEKHYYHHYLGTLDIMHFMLLELI